MITIPAGILCNLKITGMLKCLNTMLILLNRQDVLYHFLDISAWNRWVG